MKLVKVKLKSAAPYSQSRMHDTEELDREGKDAFEKRTWREKCTVNEDGIVCIPAMALKQMLDASAKLLGIQIPGKGKSTYTKHFKAGVMCQDSVPLGIRKEDVESVSINANADGVRGSGKRVKRIFPIIPEWSGTATFVIYDDTVTREVFERHLTEAGKFVGIGRFRPENGGFNGRFNTVSFDWSELK